MMTLTKMSRFRGAFLLEALIAIVILSVGLTAVIRSFMIGLDAYQRNQEYQGAVILLENTLTDFLVQRYFDESLVGSGQYEEPFSGYQYKILADNVPDRPALREVSVTVSWKVRKKNRSLQATTYLLAEPQDEG